MVEQVLITKTFNMTYEELKTLADQSLADVSESKNFGRDKVSDLVSVSSFENFNNVIVSVSAKLKIGKLTLWRCTDRSSSFYNQDKNLAQVKKSCTVLAKLAKLTDEIPLIESAQSIDDLLHDGSEVDNASWNAAFEAMYKSKP